jgi:hypothetical protein
MEKRCVGKHLCFLAVLLLVGICMGTVLLFAVFALPTFPMQEHVRQSMPILEAEFEHSEVIQGYPASLVGGFTDCLMLEHAISNDFQYPLAERVLMMTRGEYSEGTDWAPGESLKAYLTGAVPKRMVTYARYWHGYLVILKPLLLFWNVGTIRIFAAMLQFLMACAFLTLCCKRGEPAIGLSAMVALLFLYSFTVYFSLSLSICYYIAVAAMLIQGKSHEALEKNRRYDFFFLLVGMSTSYFDFLTYPLITLGMPLLLFLAWTQRKGKRVWSAIGRYSLLWGIGYVGMWAGKWVITDIWLKEGVIGDALATLLTRTDTVENYTKITGFLVTLGKNLSPYANGPFLLLFGGSLLFMLGKWYRQGKSFAWKKVLSERLPFMAVALYPFIWFFVTQNHGEQHYMFTCKTFAITVLALLLAARSPKKTAVP